MSSAESDRFGVFRSRFQDISINVEMPQQVIPIIDVLMHCKEAVTQSLNVLDRSVTLSSLSSGISHQAQADAARVVNAKFIQDQSDADSLPTSKHNKHERDGMNCPH